MIELPANHIHKPDYKKWLQRTCWTFRTKHWWETELILLSCDIDPDRTHFNLVNDLLEYAAIPNSYDNRLVEAKLRFDQIVRAISCGSLTVKNIAPPDYSNPETIYLINAVEFLEWLKSVGLSYPSGFDYEMQTSNIHMVADAPPRQHELEADELQPPNDQIATDTPTRQHESEKDDRLEGWKQIAYVFKLTTKTVQRWEKLDPPLPITRTHSRRVFASKQEILTWYQVNSISEKTRCHQASTKT